VSDSDAIKTGNVETKAAAPLAGDASNRPRRRKDSASGNGAEGDGRSAAPKDKPCIAPGSLKEKGNSDADSEAAAADIAMPLAVLRALPDIVFAFDPAGGDLLLANPAFEQRMGRRQEADAELRVPQDVVMEKDHDRFRRAVRDALAHGEARLELRLLQASGRHFPCECVLSAWAHQKRQGVVVQARDISQREKERRQLLAYARELKEVTRRTQHASAQKSAFMAALSHEIRTPLNVILGMAEVLQRTELDARQNKYLSLLETSGRSLLHLLGDILDYSRVESGQVQLQQTPLDIRMLLQQTVELLQNKAQDKGLELHLDVDDEVPWLLVADETRLGQVLRNLVDNAIKYTDSGSVHVAATLAEPAQQKAPVALRIVVRDTGKGISREMQERIFQPFFQVREQKSSQKGAGLGLAICKQIVVELFKGTLRVKSELGKGSAFVLDLLLDVPEEGQEVMAQRFECVAQEPALQDSPPLRLLCVEDAVENRELLQTFFEDVPHSIEFAEDGETGVDMFERALGDKGYDAVLMDIQLPGIDGLEAARRIRKLETHGRRVPLIALTAYALRNDRKRCLDAGCDLYVSKPFRRSELFAALNRCLSQEGGEAAAAEAQEAAREQAAGDEQGEVAADYSNTWDVEEFVPRLPATEVDAAAASEHAQVQFAAGDQNEEEQTVQRPDASAPVPAGEEQAGVTASAQEAGPEGKQRSDAAADEEEAVLEIPERAPEEVRDAAAEEGGGTSAPSTAETDSVLAGQAAAFAEEQAAAAAEAPPQGEEADEEPEWTPEAVLEQQRFDVTPSRQMLGRVSWYTERLQVHLKNLEQALHDNDAETLGVTGHKLKGSASGFGFGMVSVIGAGLEAAAKNENMDEAARWIEALRHFAQRVHVAAGD